MTKKSANSNRSIRSVFTFLLIFILAIIGGICALNLYLYSNDFIYNGLKINNIDLGGYTKREAKAMLDTMAKNDIKNAVNFKHQDIVLSLKAEEILLSMQTEQAIEEAYHFGRTGNIVTKLGDRYKLLTAGINIPLKASIDIELTRNHLSEFAKKINTEPIDATVILQNNNIKFESAKNGKRFDVDATIIQMLKNIENEKNFSTDVIITEIPATIQTSDIEHINTVLATYSTKFNSYDINRSTNLRIASDSINDTILKNCEIFSFNDIVGSRTPQNGYQIAPVYFNGRLVPDWGGGVCQVSTTLYNAVLLANMDIKERSCHFRPPAYVPIGFDATVADGAIDFKFINTNPKAIIIKSEIIGNNIHISLLGEQQLDNPKIELVSGEVSYRAYKIINKPDPTLDEGKKIIEENGEEGCVVSTYRIKRTNDQVEHELLATDEFMILDQIVRVGSKKQATTKTPTNKSSNPATDTNSKTNKQNNNLPPKPQR